MQFNTSTFNPIGLGFQEETTNGQSVQPHSNEIDVVRSQLLANNHTIDLHQNENFSQSLPIVGLGQLGLSQRMTNIRSAIGTPHRVQVHTQIDYLPTENQQTLPKSEVSVIEVARTRFFKESLSTENIFVSTDIVPIQEKSNSQNQDVNNLFTRNNPFQGPFYQNMIKYRQVHNLKGFSDHSDPKRDGFCPTVTQIRQALNRVGFVDCSGPKRNEVLSPTPISVYAPEANLNPSMNESSSNQTRVSNLTNPRRAPRSEKDPSPARVPSPIVQNDPNGDYNIEDDGRTHSLPTKKNGPYICPKCERVFITSQCFAAHIGSHYKNESKDERKKRQAARYKKKYLRRFESREGLTVMPPSLNMVSGRNSFGKRKLVTKIKEKEVLQQEHVVQEVATKRDLPSVGVKIKEEPK